VERGFLDEIRREVDAYAPTSWGLLAPKPLGFNPLRKGMTPEREKENAERLLTTNSLFMDTKLGLTEGAR
jgi:hypothetical protein